MKLKLAAAALALISLSLTACTSFNSEADHPVAKQPAASLSGSSWMMQTAKGEGCEVPPVIEFSENRIAGDLGCNRVMGFYEIENDKIKFDQVATTMKLCAPEYMELEKQMSKIFTDSRTFKKTDSELSFFNDKGELVMTLVPEKAGACD